MGLKSGLRNTIRIRLNGQGLQFMEPLTRNWSKVDGETAGLFLRNVLDYQKLPKGRETERVRFASPENPERCECSHLRSQHSEDVAGEGKGRVGLLCLDSHCSCYHFRSSDPVAREERRKRFQEKQIEKNLNRRALKAVAGLFGPGAAFGLGLQLAQEGKL